MTIATHPFDPAEFLETAEDIAAYLNASLEDGDAGHVADALGVIARAKGMSALARETGLTRASLYKSLSEQGNPEFVTVFKVIRALGLRITVDATSPAAA